MTFGGVFGAVSVMKEPGGDVGSSLADARRGARRARFAGGEVDCPVYVRERLDIGLRVEGPAILEQLDSTTVIGPGQVARVDEWKNLIVMEGG